MDRPVLKEIFGIAFLAALFFISGCDKQTAHETGVLEGVISIGPLCPVEKIPPDPGCLPTAETYKAYPVGVWTSNGSRKIAQINPALDGSFSTELAPGNYLVLLEKEQNNIGGSNLPAGVSIISGGTTLLNINIDTGIR
ncbi:MAG: hypothetical protein D4R64_10165 [Porphyromonadaceae bacterium]|nr:MAG: hypothetical protein D4R64_10165 [Porphyromonadaceae bacterium]